jgi:hypothetical protein
MVSFVRAISLAILEAIVVLAQPSSPAQGVQMGVPGSYDLRFPLTVTQCEPVFIYYNVDPITYSPVFFAFWSASTLDSSFLFFGPFLGIGYFEWICNIPAGYSFQVVTSWIYTFIVQPGSSSSCLGNITTTYSYAAYATTAWTSYTALPPTVTTSYTGGLLATYVYLPSLVSP